MAWIELIEKDRMNVASVSQEPTTLTHLSLIQYWIQKSFSFNSNFKKKKNHIF